MRGARHKQYASCVVRFVQEAPHARHQQSTAGVLGEKVSIGDTSSGRAKEKQTRLERVRLYFDGERRVVGIKAPFWRKFTDYAANKLLGTVTNRQFFALRTIRSLQQRTQGSAQIGRNQDKNEAKEGAGDKMRAEGERGSGRQGENERNAKRQRRRSEKAEEARG